MGRAEGPQISRKLSLDNNYCQSADLRREYLNISKPML